MPEGGASGRPLAGSNRVAKQHPLDRQATPLERLSMAHAMIDQAYQLISKTVVPHPQNLSDLCQVARATKELWEALALLRAMVREHSINVENQ